jgi:uncharacterized protein (DUF2141 family)
MGVIAVTLLLQANFISWFLWEYFILQGSNIIPTMSLFLRSLICLIVLLPICALEAQAQNIEIFFSGIRSAKGQIIVKVFTSSEGFDDDKPVKAIKFNKVGMAGGEMTGKLDLEPGVYGLALLDDENGDTEMEYNMLRMPKEGFGFSNFYLTGLKRPKFEQFKFVLQKGQKLKVNMKARYL